MSGLYIYLQVLIFTAINAENNLQLRRIDYIFAALYAENNLITGK